MQETSNFLIDDFSGERGTSAIGTEWRLFTDRVMGGVSDATSTLETVEGRRCMRLRGRVSLENNGGFIQVALPLARGGRPFDAGEFKGVRAWVRGNGKTYHIHLRTAQTRSPGSISARPSTLAPAGGRSNFPLTDSNRKNSLTNWTPEVLSGSPLWPSGNRWKRTSPSHASNSTAEPTMRRAVALWGIFVLAAAASASAQTLEHKGLVASWLVGKFEQSVNPQVGVRYIPEFSLSQKFSGSFSLAAELSLNGFGVAQFLSGEDTQTDGDLEPYRFWLRLSTSRFEARLGLQKINFGSAALLRPLMWFDSLDPRDPLQLTDGVYGLLVRYYFQNNANIWALGIVRERNRQGLGVRRHGR